MNKKNGNKKIIIRLVIVIGFVMGTCQPMRAGGDMAPESEQRATQQDLLDQEQASSESVATSPLAGTAEKVSAVQDRINMVLVLKIRERMVANKALKQSVLAHDQKIAELEQKIEKKNQTWFDWAASFFKAAEQKPEEIGQGQLELQAVTAAYMASTENYSSFDQRFLAGALKKQIQYGNQLKKMIEKQKQQINKLEAILENS